jgi:hypothetical protein
LDEAGDGVLKVEADTAENERFMAGADDVIGELGISLPDSEESPGTALLAVEGVGDVTPHPKRRSAIGINQTYNQVHLKRPWSC